jgi:hypothetical protein
MREFGNPHDTRCRVRNTVGAAFRLIIPLDHGRHAVDPDAQRHA